MILFMFHSRMRSLVLWEVDATLRNGYEIQGQNYVELLQGSGTSIQKFYIKWNLNLLFNSDIANFLLKTKVEIEKAQFFLFWSALIVDG